MAAYSTYTLLLSSGSRLFRPQPEDAPQLSEKKPIYFLVFPSFATKPQSRVLRHDSSMICFMHEDKTET
jgi:hypothetical protein